MLARRYVDWLGRHVLAVLAAGIAVLVVAGYLAIFHLPMRADLSHLLPQDAPSVKDLRKLEARVTSQDTILVLVKAADPSQRAAVAAELATAIRALPSTLVKRVEVDDGEARKFLFAHRHLFVPYEDLVAARDAIAHQIEHAKLAANPLFIRLDDDDEPTTDAASATLDRIHKQRAEAEARAGRSGYVSSDNATQLIVVRTAFARSAVREGEQLIGEIRAAARRIVGKPFDASLEVGVAAGVVSAVAEHHALVRGMLLSSIVTSLLVALVLILYFRSVRLLVLLSLTLVVGTTAAFGVAALAVGHLNVATAFLGAIIAGNGVNYGILLIARYLEERARSDAATAMAIAITETLRPTIVASLGAAIAYGSLAATSFRGFADFAVIGGVGMLLCWLASYTLLPAIVLRWGPTAAPRSRSSAFGAVLARALGFRNSRLVCALAAVAAVVAGLVSYRYVTSDPFEYDLKNLRSRGAEATEARHWVQRADAAFGRGIAGQTIIAVDDPDDVPLVVSALHGLDTIGTVRSILDVIPDRQADKLALLGEIRSLIDKAIPAAQDAHDRETLTALRPPDGLEAITPALLPEEIAVRLREQDGRIGYQIGVRPAPGLDDWDGRALIRFANEIRRIQLPNGKTITTSGNHVIFADIISTLRADGPRVVLVALLCLIVMTVLLAGGATRALAVLVSIGLGSAAMIALCAVIGVRVTFLDFVALPITLGLGVDYAINIAHRFERGGDLGQLLRTTGLAVFVCSLTTMIGYGSLLVSDNGAIRGFGVAALIGEGCCVMTALIVVPAVLRALPTRR